ncbi:hypothetical protein NIES4074_40540 [Cylindrospermum sp. NIES-4074]|nr:hypothetical protein NIES4074_40540 [Cylindrospermum sp. NIES-4074]
MPLPDPKLGIPRNPFGSPGVTKNPNLRLPPAHDGDTVTMIEDPLNPGGYIPKFKTPTGGTSTPSSNKGGAIVHVRNTAVNTGLTVPSSSQSGAIASIKALPPASETNITGVPPHLRNLIPQINTPPTGTSTTSSSQSGAIASIKALLPANGTNNTGGQIVPLGGASTTSSQQSGAIVPLKNIPINSGNLSTLGKYGLTVPDIIYACRMLEVMDLPEYMWENPPIDIFNNEIWVISRLCPEPGAKECLIEGEELRHLLKEAKLVRAARDAKLQTS